MTTTHTFRVGFLACGLGAGARGFIEARAAVGQHGAQFENVGGVDIDLAGLADFKQLATGPTVVGDLHTMQPADLIAAWGPRAPHAVFSSTPCKGMSRLLGAAAAARDEYQALNRLTLEAFHLVVTTYAGDPPELLILENVPGIMSRGAELLAQIRSLLAAHGYVFHESTHDCGEIGGLGQHRRRFLMVARHAKKLGAFLYQPPKQRVRTCGEIIGPLPLPNDANAGTLHALPQISWVNWVRLALIPPGGDWRDLPRALETQPDNPAAHQNKHAVGAFDAPAATVIGATRPGSGAPSVADKRVRALGDLFAMGHEPHRGGHGVQAWTAPAKTVRGASNVRTGPGSVADPRVVVGKTGTNSATFKGRPGYLGVDAWDDPAPAVTGNMGATDGTTPGAIADRRLFSPLAPGQARREIIRRHAVQSFADPMPAVTGPGCNAVESVADPRVALGCTPRAGAYGVAAFDQPLDTVTGSASIDNGRVAIADPRVQPPLPPGYVVMTIDEALAHATSPKARPAPGVIPVIFSPHDGTWHRPLTTLDLAALQGIPTRIDGQPLQLAGKSAAAHRERIGNAVPVGAAKAIAGEMLRTLLVGVLGMFILGNTPIWCKRATVPDFYARRRRDPEPQPGDVVAP